MKKEYKKQREEIIRHGDKLLWCADYWVSDLTAKEVYPLTLIICWREYDTWAYYLRVVNGILECFKSIPVTPQQYELLCEKFFDEAREDFPQLTFSMRGGKYVLRWLSKGIELERVEDA